MTHEHAGRSYEQAVEYLGKEVKLKIDRPLGSFHPTRDFQYLVNYGYIPDTIAPDGEGIDAYYLGVNEPVEEGEGVCIAIIHRRNDDDDSIVVVPGGIDLKDEDIKKAVEFQEQFFDFTIMRI